MRNVGALLVFVLACGPRPPNGARASEPSPCIEPAPAAPASAEATPIAAPRVAPPPPAASSTAPTPAPTPTVRIGIINPDPKESTGRLPPEVIQREVRKAYGEFRKCFEAGLTASPNLQGRVSVRFVIERNGSVSNVSNGGSDLPNAETVACILKSFYAIKFPPPDGGSVTVVYPIILEPG